MLRTIPPSNPDLTPFVWSRDGHVQQVGKSSESLEKGWTFVQFWRVIAHRSTVLGQMIILGTPQSICPQTECGSKKVNCCVACTHACTVCSARQRSVRYYSCKDSHHVKSARGERRTDDNEGQDERRVMSKTGGVQFSYLLVGRRSPLSRKRG